MTAKTLEEKKRLKDAKRSYKRAKLRERELFTNTPPDISFSIEPKLYEDETVLADDYNVHMNYYYLIDLKVIRSPIESTILGLKNWYKSHQDKVVSEIRRCNLIDRTLDKHGKL